MSDQNSTIGERVQALRLRKGLSVEEIAEAAGISEAGIEKIENDGTSPPLGHIISLAEALKVPVGDLFGDEADSPFCIVRSGHRKVVSRFGSAESTSGGYSYESLGHKKQNRHMEPFLVTLNPTEEHRLEPNQHVGEEVIFVLGGQVDVKLADHTDVLNPGDSIYYDSNLPHVVSCHGDQPATILAVIYARKEIMVF